MPPDAPAADAPAVNDGGFGLDADEQAAFDAMRAEPAPTGDPGHVDSETPAEPAAPETPAPIPGSEPPIAAATPAAEPADEGDDEDAAPAADGRTPKRVSFNKFKRAEDAAAAAVAELKTEREKNAKSAETQARLDERLRLINEALTTQPPAAPEVDEDPEPDPEADIFGHNAWLKRQLVKTQSSLSEFREQVETGQQASAADQAMASTYMDDAARFAQTEPNFGPAYAYLMQVRVAQLASFHFGKDLTDAATPPLTTQELVKIKSEVAREEKQLVSTAIKNNKSPAAEVFRMAKMTGYRPAPAAAAPAPTNGTTPQTPAAPAAPTNGAPKPSVTAVIDGIKKGQDAALSLSHGGGAPAPVLNMEKLATMPEDEFGALLETMTPAALRRIMGGP